VLTTGVCRRRKRRFRRAWARAGRLRNRRTHRHAARRVAHGHVAELVAQPLDLDPQPRVLRALSRAATGSMRRPSLAVAATRRGRRETGEARRASVACCLFASTMYSLAACRARAHAPRSSLIRSACACARDGRHALTPATSAPGLGERPGCRAAAARARSTAQRAAQPPIAPERHPQVPAQMWQVSSMPRRAAPRHARTLANECASAAFFCLSVSVSCGHPSAEALLLPPRPPPPSRERQ
jgi:hypothetical protein